MSAPWGGGGYPPPGGYGGRGYGNPHGGVPIDAGRRKKKRKKDKPPFLVLNPLTPRGRRTSSLILIIGMLGVSHAWHTDTVQQMRISVTTIVQDGVQLHTSLPNPLNK